LLPVSRLSMQILQMSVYSMLSGNKDGSSAVRHVHRYVNIKVKVFMCCILLCRKHTILFTYSVNTKICESLQMTYLQWGRVSNVKHISITNWSSSGAVSC
jgi:hypothetical protein